jgi:hypothetical protein
VNDHQAVERGREAAGILGSETWKEAFRMAREEYHTRWIGTNDREEQYQAWAQTRALEDIERQLRKLVSQGQHSAERLRRQKV